MYKSIAINETKENLKNYLEVIKNICNHLGYYDLVYNMYLLRILRLKKLKEIDTLKSIKIDRDIDILKFMISVIYKYSNISKVEEFDYRINEDKVDILFEFSQKLHNLYERLHNFTMCNNIELDEKNNSYIIALNKEFENEKFKKSYQYIARYQETINKEKKNLLHVDELLEDFITKYSQYDLISKDIFGLNINEIAQKVNEVIKTSNNLIEEKLPSLNGEIYDSREKKTISSVINSFVFNEKTLFNIFGKKGMKFIRKITFKKSDFNSHDLSFHYITRVPILKIRNNYIISTELLLDSLINNFHYSILENKQYSEKHKKIMSDSFVNEISKIGENHGLKYIDSEVELYQGKNKLGDIDLILRDEKNNCDILIEAKNHAVPLSVYFGDYEQIEKRLNELQQTWEKKVEKRHKYLIENNKEINICKDFKYIIVSKWPEILSHYSNYLVLSLKEFEFYLQNNRKFFNFESLYKEYYQQEKFNSEDLNLFMHQELGFKIEKKEKIN